MHNVVLITNIPVPYRENIHEMVSNTLKESYTVIYCSSIEPDRFWSFDYGSYKRFFLSHTKKKIIHNNFLVWKKLQEIKPDIIITTGFNPTMLYSFIWSILYKKKHISFTDGTLKSERDLSILHKIIRKIVYSRTEAFIGPGKGNHQLYKSYNIPDRRIFRSLLCVNNSIFSQGKLSDKTFDLMFSGQFIDRKLPFFFIEVAKLVKDRIGICKVLLLGDGYLKEEMIRQLDTFGIEYEYPGFVNQSMLPSYFRKTKIFLFPTKNDPWGVVANEAMAAGVPVITCENAGVANDLVIHNRNGFVLPLSCNIWAEHVIRLLNDQNLYEELSLNALTDVQNYNFENAAEGLLEAIRFVIDEK